MRLEWDKDGDRLYETGVDRGVLYKQKSDASYDTGEAWNGLTGVTESPSGAEPTDIWADNMKYLTLRSPEDYAATVTCYTYPDGWKECDGRRDLIPGVTIGQQKRSRFGMTWRTLIGNDVDGDDHGYKIHIVWNATASVSERAYQTESDSPEAIEFSYEITTTGIKIEGYRTSAAVEIDSTKIDEAKLTKIENTLYGTADKEPTLPTLPDFVALLNQQ